MRARVGLEPGRNRSAKSSTECPACLSTVTIDFISMYGIPVHVCVLWETPEQARRAPRGDITLTYCFRCGFVHNRQFDPQRVSFEPGYEASLVHSAMFRRFQNNVVRRLIDRYDVRGKRVVEIGCGHGEFLSSLCEQGGNEGIGFDPTVDREGEFPAGSGTVRLVRDYYTRRHADLEPDVVCCLSVFEDIPDPIAFLNDLRETLGDRQPLIYFEIFNASYAFRHRQTWSVHYEQCNYFGLESFTGLFERCGFEVVESGECYEDGQYLFIDAIPRSFHTTLESKFRPERGLPPEIRDFAEHHRVRTEEWRRRLKEYGRDQRRVVAWGTGGKGITFLNLLETSEGIPYAVDINPDRQGLYVPGSAQKIVAPSFLERYEPETIIITNPLYEEEIRNQVAEMGISCEYVHA